MMPIQLYKYFWVILFFFLLPQNIFGQNQYFDISNDKPCIGEEITIKPSGLFYSQNYCGQWESLRPINDVFEIVRINGDELTIRPKQSVGFYLSFFYELDFSGGGGNCNVSTSPGEPSFRALIQPKITKIPKVTLRTSPTNICKGSNVTFIPNVSGINRTPRYEWRVNGALVSSSTSISRVINEGTTVSVRVISQDECNNNESATASIAINPTTFNPVIRAEGETTFCDGRSVRLTTVFNANQTYQWKREGSNIPGANSYYYDADVTGEYRIAITEGLCTKESNKIYVQVNNIPATPTITRTGSATFCGGEQNTTLTASSSGSGMRYNWYVNGVSYHEKTRVITPDISGTYRVEVIQNGCKSIRSSGITINAITPPSPPAYFNTTGTEGQSLELKARSDNVPSNNIITHEWYTADNPIPSNLISSSAITGLFERPNPGLPYYFLSSYTITLTNSRSYWVRAVKTVNGVKCYSEIVEVPVRVNGKPTITSAGNTINKTICYNTSAGLLNPGNPVIENNYTNFTYQWQKRTNGIPTDIQGATSATYTPNENLTTYTEYIRKLTVNYPGGSVIGYLYARINVYDQFIPGSFSTTTYNICSDDNLTLSLPVATGPEGNPQYQWQVSNNNSTWRSLSNQNGRNLTITPALIASDIKANPYIRRYATFPGSCSPRRGASNVVTVNVSEVTEPQIEISDNFACEFFTITASNPNGGVAHTWYKEASRINQIPSTINTNNGYSSQVKERFSENTTIWLAVTAPNCPPLLKRVDIRPKTPTFRYTEKTQTLSICTGESPNLIPGTPSPSNGLTDYRVDYKWFDITQSNTSSVVISREGNYNPRNLQQAKKFRRETIVRYGAGYECSSNPYVDEYTINVNNSAFVPGNIQTGTASDFTKCGGESFLINADPPSGGNGAYRYQWEYSTSPISGFIPINTTETQNPNLSISTEFSGFASGGTFYLKRKVFTVGSCTDEGYSNTVAIIIDQVSPPEANPPTSVLGAPTIFIAYSQDLDYSDTEHFHQWRTPDNTIIDRPISSNQGSPMETKSEFSFNVLNENVTLQVRAVKNGCFSAWIDVNPKFPCQVTIEEPTTMELYICQGESPGLLVPGVPVVSGCTNNNMSTTYYWYEIIDGVKNQNPIDDGDNDDTTLDPGGLDISTSFERETVVNISGRKFFSVLTIDVIVEPNFNAGSIDQTNSTICEGDDFTLTASPANGTPYNVTYQWQHAPSVSGPFTDIAGATDEFYTLPTSGQLLYDRPFYQRVAIGAACERETTPVQVTVNPAFAQNAVITSAGITNICNGEAVTLMASPIDAAYTYDWYLNERLIQSGSDRLLRTDQGGSYTVIVSNGVCNTAPSQAVVLNESSSANLIINTAGGNNLFCNPNGIRLFVPQIAGVTYTWRRDNNSITTQLNPYEINADQVGTYTVSIDNGSCNSTSEDFQVVNQPIDPNNQNYIRTFTTQVAEMDENITLQSNPNAVETMVSTQYFDGLGRPIQTVNRQASPGMKDMVTFNVYDAFGRKPKQYLPYAATEANGLLKPCPIPEQTQFYKNASDGIADSDFPFALTQFENSPLNRVDAQLAPGESWVGANRKMVLVQESNTLEDKIWKFTIANTTEAIPQTDGYYPTGELYLSRTVDEMGGETLEYTDKKGRVILKQVKLTPDNTNPNNNIEWLNTYYVYDDYDNLRFVLPPELIKQCNDNFFGDKYRKGLEMFAFKYFYDIRNRLVIKKVPGTGDTEGQRGEVHMVYDDLDRLVLSQDAEQREDKVWAFTKYDQLSRPVITGIWRPDNPASANRTNVQTDLDQVTGNTLFVFTRDAAGNTRNSEELTGRRIDVNSHNGQKNFLATEEIRLGPGFNYKAPRISADGLLSEIRNITVDETYEGTWTCGYYDATFPEIVECEVRTVSYYDDYSFTDVRFSFDYEAKLQLQENENYLSQPIYRVKGMLTGSKVRILGTENFLTTISFYDDRDRVIQTYAENHTGGIDIQTTRYDFVGRVLKTHLDHSYEEEKAPVEVIKVYAYDHMGRVTQVKQAINEEKPIELANHVYNELGELMTKNLAPEGGDIAQKVDYNYNIRGWLKGMNAVEYGAQVNDDFFLMELFYDEPTQGGNAIGYQPQYNGNIAAISWQSATDNHVRDYAYQYDLLNRIKSANYSSAVTAENGRYDVSGIEYDFNGNIKNLNRQGAIALNPQETSGFDYGAMDGLTYTYSGNRLKQVTDATAVHLAEAGDFNDADTLENDYFYDLNGNLIRDFNKGIQNIRYNYLNLPEKITVTGKGSIEYLYDAAGIKLQKTVIEGSQIVKKIDYIEEFVYENDALQFLHTEESRALSPEAQGEMPDGTLAENFAYEFHCKDHLGNLRVAFRDRNFTYTATMEPEDVNEEEKFFDNIARTLDTSKGKNSTGSALLNASNSIGRVVGPYIELAVKPGDHVNASVWVSYTVVGRGQSSFTMGNILQNSIGGESGGILSNTLFTPIALGNNLNDDPNTYLRITFYDKDGNIVDDLSETKWVASMEGGDWRELTLINGIDITQEGTIAVYVANESDVDVSYDNLEITISHNPIVQENHYYPFGLNLAGLEKQGQPDHKFQFQGQEVQEEFGLNWISFKWRNHDPSIGRFFNVDPLAEDYVYNSPYAFSENKVTNHIELEGLEAISAQIDARVAIPIKVAGVTASGSAGFAVGRSDNGEGTHVVPFVTGTLGVSGGAGFAIGPSGSMNLTASLEDLGGLGANAGGFMSSNPAGYKPTGGFEFNSTANFDLGATVAPPLKNFSLGTGGALYLEAAYTVLLSEPVSLSNLGDTEMVQQIADMFGISVDEVVQHANDLNDQLNNAIESDKSQKQQSMDKVLEQRPTIESDNTHVNNDKSYLYE